MEFFWSVLEFLEIFGFLDSAPRLGLTVLTRLTQNRPSLVKVKERKVKTKCAVG